jgi:hypothetical protein
MNSPNLELIDAVMDHIDTHPEEWDQCEWICGTVACFAGRAVLIDGWQDDRSTGYVKKNGDRRFVEGLAEDILGLSFSQSGRLFYPGNTLDDLHSMVKQLHGAPDEQLSWEPGS